MQGKSLISLISFGTSVAEFDRDLEDYFIETETFRSAITDSGDIIAGDKGTGKTAIYRILKKNYRSYDVLQDVEVVDAFNPTGDPVFQRLTLGPDLSEAQYRTFWKAYIFSLAGNWLYDIYGPYNDELKELSATLEYLDLKSTDVSPATVFGRLYSHVRKLTSPKSLEVGMTITETGLPVLTPRAEFGLEKSKGDEIFNGDYLSVLNRAIKSVDLQLWILFDRLDEAFAGRPDVEVPALRALMRSYLDLQEYDALRLKLFLRKDLFRKITFGGFVNLTHINARRIEIVWEEDDLIDMIVRRVNQNSAFRELVPHHASNEAVMSFLLSEQIDVGERKPSAKNWVMSRIRDGNDNKPPRNLIDLMNKAKETQARREQREEREVAVPDGPVIEPDSVKTAFVQLSELRVQDTLLAEAADLSSVIDAFRDGKSEHNRKTLHEVISQHENIDQNIRSLIDMGFLEEFGENFKIPMLYRDGLKVKQGKAF